MIVRDFSTLRTLGYRAAHSTINTVNISAYLGKDKEVKVPSSVASIIVETISPKAFADCDTEVVHLPRRLIKLEEDVFKDSKVTEVHVNSLLMEVSDLGKKDITLVCPKDSFVIPQLKKLKINYTIDESKKTAKECVEELLKLATTEVLGCAYVNSNFASESKTKLYVKLDELNFSSENNITQYTISEEDSEVVKYGKNYTSNTINSIEVLKHISGKYQLLEDSEEPVISELKETSIFGNRGAM